MKRKKLLKNMEKLPNTHIYKYCVKTTHLCVRASEKGGLFMKRSRDKAFLEKEIRFIFYDSVNEKYADIILEQKNISGISLLDEIINYVMDSQEWEAGTYSDADIRLAIGKTLTKRLGCSIQK